jgi:P-type conjugative transfer protein TrbJ
MRSNHAGATAWLALTLLTAAPQTVAAQTVVCANCATEITQILNKLQLIDQLTQQVRLVTDAALNSRILDQQTFSKALTDIRAINQILAQAKGISFAGQGLDTQIAQKYPDFATYLQRPINDVAMAAKQREWSEDNTSDVQAALKAARRSGEQIAGTENDYITELEAKAQTTEGRLQAIQVANLIGIEGLRQAQKLRSDLLVIASLLAGEMKRQSDQKAAEAAAWETFRKFSPLPTNKGSH